MVIRARIEEGVTEGLVTEQTGFLKKVVTEQISKNCLYRVVFSTFFVISCIIMQ